MNAFSGRILAGYSVPELLRAARAPRNYLVRLYRLPLLKPPANLTQRFGAVAALPPAAGPCAFPRGLLPTFPLP